MASCKKAILQHCDKNRPDHDQGLGRRCKNTNAKKYFNKISAKLISIKAASVQCLQSTIEIKKEKLKIFLNYVIDQKSLCANVHTHQATKFSLGTHHIKLLTGLEHLLPS